MCRKRNFSSAFLNKAKPVELAPNESGQKQPYRKKYTRNSISKMAKAEIIEFMQKNEKYTARNMKNHEKYGNVLKNISLRTIQT